jgi:signal transduction histidine kinase
MELLPKREAQFRPTMEQPVEPAAGEICAVLARELRIPLSTIEGFVDLLASGGVGPVTDEQREILDVVSHNIRRLSSVVGDWYDLSRLEAGALELTREQVDLEEIADRAVAALRPRIRVKEQQVSVEVPAEPALALGDPRGLLRVVGHLLSNAHKFTPSGGEIRLLLAVEGDETVRLDVIDNGLGIRDEDQPRIFRKFFRAHLTEAEPGSGLGLALTRLLVERMKGQITVRSALGEGSTFTLMLRRPVEVGPEPGPGSDPLADADRESEPVTSLPPLP